MTFAVEWIVDIARLAELSGEWNAVLPAVARPFDLHGWYTAWWKSFGRGNELAICTVRDGDALAGVLPMQRRGHGLEALANSHSGVFRPLASSPEAMEVLIGAAVKDASSLTLRELREGEPEVEALAGGARRAGAMTLLEEAGTSPMIDTSGDLDAWVTESHSSWKKRLRRYRRKMEKDHEATFEIARSPGDLEAELAEGFALEASGWKGEAGTAIVSQPETESFYRAIATEFHGRGELRLSRIALDGEPVAFSFCLERDGRLYSLKAGFDERFRHLVPGLVMQLSIVEACFERDLEAYELLGEQAEWKAKLATSTRSHVNLRAYRRNPAGISRYAYRTTLRPRLRRVRRRLRGSEGGLRD
jgi:CelD/BcsL family acetyltransferase involved in cellulose biosynthesis